MSQTPPKTRIADYVGDVFESLGQCLTEARDCAVAALDHSDALQRSARTAVHCVFRPGSRADPDDVAELRAQIAGLAARLSRYESAPGDAPAPDAA